MVPLTSRPAVLPDAEKRPRIVAWPAVLFLRCSSLSARAGRRNLALQLKSFVRPIHKQGTIGLSTALCYHGLPFRCQVYTQAAMAQTLDDAIGRVVRQCSRLQAAWAPVRFLRSTALLESQLLHVAVLY